MSKWALGVACLSGLVSCGGNNGTGAGGNGGSVAHCVPGDSKSCTGPGPCSGYQICNASGTYDACNCPGGTGGSGGTGGVGGSAGRGGAGGSVSCTSTAGEDSGAGTGGSVTTVDAGRDRYVGDGPSTGA